MNRFATLIMQDAKMTYQLSHYENVVKWRRVNAFESYRLTDSQTNTTEIT